MGRSYLFECPKCGYRAKVSGRADRGFDFQVQTILCRDCKALYDAVVRLKMPHTRGPKAVFGLQQLPANRQIPDSPPAFESVLNRLPVQGRHFKWVQFGTRCPVSSAHKVRPWNEPDKCPKCGIYLEKNALPYRIWE